MKRMLTSKLQRTHVRFGFCGTMNIAGSNIKLLALLQSETLDLDRALLVKVSVDNKERERASTNTLRIPHHPQESHRPRIYEGALPNSKALFRQTNIYFSSTFSRHSKKQASILTRPQFKPTQHTTTTSQQVPYHLLFIKVTLV
jgi:hypothetical protein